MCTFCVANILPTRQLLRDNLTLWTSEDLPDGEGDGDGAGKTDGAP